MQSSAQYGILLKCFCMKNLCVCIIDIDKKKIQADNCAKECQLNQAKLRKLKATFINIIRKTNGKK